jgi:heptosyltransferase-2
MMKILIVNPFGIGDVLFTAPLIKAIKNNSPNSFIGYWCNEEMKVILEKNPDINIIFAFSRGDFKKIFGQAKFKAVGFFLKLLNKIKKEKFDVAFDLSLDRRYAFFLRLLGIPRVIGFDYKNRGRLLTDKIQIDYFRDKHVIEYYLELLKFIDIKPTQARLELSVLENKKNNAKDLLERVGLSDRDLIIGIVPGAGISWGKNASFKHWPAIKYAQLSDKLINELKAKVLLLGDEQEGCIANTILKNMRNNPAVLVGKTSLEDLVCVIGNLNLLVTNDGGPLHLGVALGIKTVSLFGPVDERVYGPYPFSDMHIVIKRDIVCRPCYKNFRFSNCSNNRRCLDDITVDEVYSAVKRLI